MFLLIRLTGWVLLCSLGSLHSTMFLLILFAAQCFADQLVDFTFHNVSINTAVNPSLTPLLSRSLHSTMFLLIRTGKNDVPAGKEIFTFHNVSINTEQWDGTCGVMIYFTFHNVSINTALRGATKMELDTLHSTMFLLIPHTPHLPITQDLFYHFLSTLSFTIFLKQNLHSQ